MLFILYNIEGKCSGLASLVMTKLMTTLTISAIASILIIGGFATATPNAFSTYGGGHNDDDDCDDWGYGNYHNNDDDNDCDNDPPKDPCDCEKPDTLKFKFSTPMEEIGSEFRIEIYKKINDIGNEDKKLMSIADVTNSLDDYQIESSSFGKDKLNSNTVFAIYKIVENNDDVLVSSIEVHTSCSQTLYIGKTVMNNGYALEVTDGLRNGETSISESDPLTCGDIPEPVKMGSIVIKNALTNDNGGEAEFADFTYKLVDVDSSTTEFDLIQDTNDPSLNEGEVPKGTYTLSQTIAVEGSYTEVLITGDKKCPSTTNEPFSIKKGKTISCTIYNDDNGDGSTGGPGGIVFQNNSMKIDIGDESILDSCDNENAPSPCIEVVNDEGTIAIVDASLVATTTIVLFSVVEDVIDPINGAVEPECMLERITPHSNLETENPTNNLTVLLVCSGMDTGIVYDINYVMIDPTI